MGRGMVGFGFGRINEMTRWVDKSGLIQSADWPRMSQNDFELRFGIECRYSEKSNLIWRTCMSKLRQYYGGILSKMNKQSDKKKIKQLHIGN
jgi:hypothetical protein